MHDLPQVVLGQVDAAAVRVGADRGGLEEGRVGLLGGVLGRGGDGCRRRRGARVEGRVLMGGRGGEGRRGREEGGAADGGGDTSRNHCC